MLVFVLLLAAAGVRADGPLVRAVIFYSPSKPLEDQVLEPGFRVKYDSCETG
jgi:hypothetical protein